MNLKEYKGKIKSRQGCSGKESGISTIRAAAKVFVDTYGKWDCKNVPYAWYAYGKIIREVHKELISKFTEGHDVHLPYSMGVLTLQKKSKKPRIVNGKLIIPYKVNWDKTLELWYTDKEAERDKILIRTEAPQAYRICLVSKKYGFKYQFFYHFKPSRIFKKAVSEAIDKGLDTIFIKKNYDRNA